MQITGPQCYGRFWDPSADMGAVLADQWYWNVKYNPSFTVDCGNSVRSKFHSEDLNFFSFNR